MKKIIFFNLSFIIIITLVFEVLLRTLFNLNVQGISKNLINDELNYRFNNSNLRNGIAFGSKVFTDKNGYRIVEGNNNSENNKEILFIGGSVTFGPGVKAEETFVELLNSNSNYTIKNASVFGSNLENHYKIIKNSDLTKVEKIFISFSLDDISDSSINNKLTTNTRDSFKEKIKSIYFINQILLFLRSNSAIYVLSKNIILNNEKRYYLNDLDLYKNKDLVKNIDKHLLKIANEFGNKKILFYIVPYSTQVSSTNCSKNDFAEDIVLKKIKKYKFKIIEIKKDFCTLKNNNKLYLKFDHAHLSPKGHRLVYKSLSDFLN